MTITTTARMLVRRWSAGTDPLRRVDLDAAMASVETYAGRFEAGLLSARPAASIRDRYWFATDVGVMFRDSGAAWAVVGAKVTGGATDQLVAGQATNLREFRDAAGNLLAAVDTAGRVLSPTTTAGGGRTTRPRCRLTGVGGGNLTTATVPTTVTFAATAIDTDAMASPAPRDGITIKVPGRYRVSAKVQWDNNPDGPRGLRLLRNGTAVAGITQPAGSGVNAAAYNGQTLGWVEDCVVNDVWAVQIIQSSGVNVGLADTNIGCAFDVAWEA